MAKNQDTITYLEARSQDVESLKTLVPRAFFDVNPRMKKLFPDTPAMQSWWGRVFQDYITNPNSHLPIAVDTATDAVVGAITLHGVLKGQPFGGFMIDHPATEDHDAEWPKAIKEFADTEESVVGDRNRLLVEVMGVDSAYQGLGVGKQLVANACEIADEKGWPIFLETSAARDYYLKQGLGFKHVYETRGEGTKGGVLLREARETGEA